MKSRTDRRRSRRIVLAAAASVWLASGDAVADGRIRAQSEPAPERPASRTVVHMTSVTGTVAMIGDDAAGRSNGVGIISHERRIYLVSDEGIGEELKKLVGRTVTVAALVKHDVDGWPYLTVEWFRVLEG